MFIVWKMPGTNKVDRWLIEVVYRDLVFLRRQSGGATALIDLVADQGLVIKPKRDHWVITKFPVSDSLNDLLYDTLDGIEVLGVPGSGGVAA